MADGLTGYYSTATLASIYLTDWHLVNMSVVVIGLPQPQLDFTQNLFYSMCLHSLFFCTHVYQTQGSSTLGSSYIILWSYLIPTV